MRGSVSVRMTDKMKRICAQCTLKKKKDSHAVWAERAAARKNPGLCVHFLLARAGL